jgi:hypothetical protein
MDHFLDEELYFDELCILGAPAFPPLALKEDEAAVCELEIRDNSSILALFCFSIEARYSLPIGDELRT